MVRTTEVRIAPEVGGQLAADDIVPALPGDLPLTHAAVVRRPGSFTDEKAERLVDDVTRLVVRFLRKS